MTVSYFVRYEVAAPEEFIQHYRDKHVPILARWPGMRRVILHHPVPWTDPCPVNRAETFLIAQLESSHRRTSIARSSPRNGPDGNEEQA